MRGAAAGVDPFADRPGSPFRSAMLLRSVGIMNDELPSDPAPVALDLVGAHRHREALALLDRSPQRSPALQLLRAEALCGLECHHRAVELCRGVVKDAACTPAERQRGMLVWARILLRLPGQTDEALELAAEAVLLAARLGEAGREAQLLAHLEAAHGFARKGCRGLAETELQQARQLGGDDARVLVTSGYLLLQFDERAAARQCFERAAGGGGDAGRRGRLGLALADALAGDFAGAQAHLDQLQPLPPDDRDAMRLQLRLLAAQARWADCIAVLDLLLAGSPLAETAPRDRCERAAMLYRAGRDGEAAAACRELAAACPQTPFARLAQRHADRLGRPTAASLPRRRLAAFPSVAQLHNNCGPAAIELYLRFFGLAAEQLEIARAIRYQAAGTPLYRMRRYLEAAGFTARRVEADLPRLRRLLDAGIPVIMEEDYSESRHVAVAIGYDDGLEVLIVQDPMSHEVRETPYEYLAALRNLSNHGALVAVPNAQVARLEAAGAEECRYIALCDEAFAARDAGTPELGDQLVEQALALRRDYELAWLYRFQRARQAAANAAPGSPERQQLRQLVEAIVQLWPDDEWPQQLVGDVLCLDQRLPEALAALEKARDRDPQDARNWVMIADCHLAAGREDHAHAALTQALRLNPAHRRANENQARQYLRLGRTTPAWIANTVARELGPDNPFNHSVHAALLAQRGDTDQALAAVARARQLAPQHPPYAIEQARLLAGAGRLDEAVTVLQELAAQRPDDPSVPGELAELLYHHGRFDAALAACQQVLARRAEHIGGIALYGAALCASGRLEAGVAELQRALAMRPAYPWALAELARFLGTAGRHAASVHCAAAAFGLSRLPAHELGLASALLAAGAHAEAARCIRNATASRLDGAGWSRAAVVLAAAEGLPAAHQFLSERARQEPQNRALLTAHAQLLLERHWVPQQAGPVLSALAAVAPDEPLALAAAGALLLDGPPAEHARGEQLLQTAIHEAPRLAAPRRLLAQRLIGRGRHDEALELLRGCPELLVDQDLRVQALLGLGRVDAAAAIAAAVEAEPTMAAAARTLRYRLACQKGDWPAALAHSEALAAACHEQDGDGHLGTWEDAKFECLLRLGEQDRARRFGDQQAGDGTSAARLARTALRLDARLLARQFAERALLLQADQPLARLVLARLAEADAAIAASA